MRALGLQTQAVIKGCAAAMATLGAWITSTSSALPALALLDDDGMAERVRQLQEDAALVLEMQNQLCEHVRPLEQTVSSTRYGSMELRDKLHLVRLLSALCPFACLPAALLGITAAEAGRQRAKVCARPARDAGCAVGGGQAVGAGSGGDQAAAAKGAWKAGKPG